MLFPLLLSLLGLATAFVPVYLGWPDLPVPVPLLLLAGAALWGWLAWRARRRSPRSTVRALVAAGQTMVPLALAVWYFQLSAYAPTVAAPVPGDLAPEITATRVKDGALFRLAAQRGHAVLLVFFRGPW